MIFLKSIDWMKMIEELYKKYRPKEFKDVIGQDDAVRSLIDMGRRKAIPHAILLTGPSGCLRGDSIIYDPIENTSIYIEQRYKDAIPFHVSSLNELGEVVIGLALPPVKYPNAEIFRVETSESEFFVTSEHLLCQSVLGEYLSVKSCFYILQKYGEVRLPSNWGSSQKVQQLNDPHCLQIKQDFQDDYLSYPCFYDEQPLEDQEICLESVPLQDDVLEHNHCYLHKDVPVSESEHNQTYQISSPLSMSHFSIHNSHGNVEESRFFSRNFESLCDSHPFLQQPLYKTNPLNTTGKQVNLVSQTNKVSCQAEYLDHEHKHLLACEPPKIGERISRWTIIKNIVPVGQYEYFDFHVLIYNNYWMNGLFHHNCGKTTIARILKNKLRCADVDFQEINSAECRGIDEIRKIQEHIHASPLAGVDKCRIWLIDEAHGLTSDAQNAFLKILEDTPKHVYFMLATTSPEKLKRTIITRCTQIKCKLLSESDLIRVIERVDKAEKDIEDIYGPLDPKIIRKIASVAEGSAREALVILHAIIGLEKTENQLAAIESSDIKKQAIEIARMLMKPKATWPQMQEILKDIEEEPETIRYMVLGYCKKVLLGKGDHKRAALIITEFMDNFYDSKTAGLVISCYNVICR